MSSCPSARYLKQLLVQQGAPTLQDAPFRKPAGCGIIRMGGKKNLTRGAFNSSHLSTYLPSPVNIPLPSVSPFLSGSSRGRVGRPSSSSSSSPSSLGSGNSRLCGGATVYLLGDYTEMSGDCRVNTLTRADGCGGPTNQSLTIRHICPLQATPRLHRRRGL